jgi:DNA-binding CsgD family transcriptional regulator
MAELVPNPAEVPSVPVAATRPEPSSREREVLALLAGGATDRQVAASLHLSPATVQTHVRNAKAKLGARTRAQAVALALQRHLIRSS